MRQISGRQTRINDEIKREISEILRELSDPRISSMTSVTKTETTKDLSNCKVYVSIFGSAEEQKIVMDGLKSANGFIRRELASRVNLRNTPELKFVLDDSIERGVRLSKLIDEANRTE